MHPTIKNFLKPFASLRITVTLLLISCLLVLAGTTAQRDMGIQDVQHQFFHSWVAKIRLHYFQPTPAAGKAYWPGWFPLPGGYLLIVMLLINLLAAHTSRFKFSRKRIGVILIHAGLIMLLVGEWATAHYAVESRMTIDVGGSAKYSEDIREVELTVVDPSPADHDNVVAIGQSELDRSARDQSIISDSRLPFNVKVDRLYENSNLRGPMEAGKEIEHLSNAGAFQKFGLERIAKFPGTEGERVDMPSGYVTILKGGKSYGSYLVSIFFERDKPQQVDVDGKVYDLMLRFRRYYKPYTVTLNKFTHDVFPGTETARNFASEIRLVDPTRSTDREVKIWMNNPLRYGGETFYQQSFANNDKTSIIQIVDNPASPLPYIACAVGALGMVIHFGMNLFMFLSRRFGDKPGTVGYVKASNRPMPAAANGKAGKGRKAANGGDSYSLQPPSRWGTVGVPAGILAICLIFVIWMMVPGGKSSDGYDWDAFGRLPIQYEGRVLPLDSLARNSLSLIGGQTVRDEKGEMTLDVRPAQWLMECMSLRGNWAKYKIIEINHPDAKHLLGLSEKERYFSWNDVFNDPENSRKLDEQNRLAFGVPEKQRDAFQHQILDLHQRLGIFLRLRQVNAVTHEYVMQNHPEQVQQMFEHLLEAIATVNPQLVQQVRSNTGAENLRAEFNSALMRLDSRKLTAQQKDAVTDFEEKSSGESLLRNLGPEEDLRLAAPFKAGESWQPIASAVTASDGNVPESAALFLSIVQDYMHQKPGDFNGDVASYQIRLQNALPAEMDRVGFEAFFNRFHPFLISMIFYVTIFVLAFVSWLAWTKPLWRSAYALLLFTLAIHTIGLISRIYISGRPPVTNLYSSAVFIAWGIVVLSAILEGIFRNGVALVAGSTAGFLSLLIASGLAASDGDTMKQLQAVLDTNFWLATHVVCVTLGYTSTFLAGVLAIIYIARGVLSSDLTAEESKDHAKMVYGILCFAMLFSFVGTILGGIWADQSWGRFWGWGSKENGAVLIVLWNALILHARWGGLARDRGVMVLAIVGNIVTSWSWFGTNMLGIGLHSYGFMQSAQTWLIIFVCSQLLIAGVGLIPMKYWASFKGASDRPGFPVSPPKLRAKGGPKPAAVSG